MEDCAQTEEYPKLILESGQLISNFLASLQMLASGAGLTEQQAKQILEMFPDLDSADYNGIIVEKMKNENVINTLRLEGNRQTCFYSALIMSVLDQDQRTTTA